MVFRIFSITLIALGLNVVAFLASGNKSFAANLTLLELSLYAIDESPSGENWYRRDEIIDPSGTLIQRQWTHIETLVGAPESGELVNFKGKDIEALTRDGAFHVLEENDTHVSYGFEASLNSRLLPRKEGAAIGTLVLNKRKLIIETIALRPQPNPKLAGGKKQTDRL